MAIRLGGEWRGESVGEDAGAVIDVVGTIAKFSGVDELEMKTAESRVSLSKKKSIAMLALAMRPVPVLYANLGPLNPIQVCSLVVFSMSAPAWSVMLM